MLALGAAHVGSAHRNNGKYKRQALKGRYPDSALSGLGGNSVFLFTGRCHCAIA